MPYITGFCQHGEPTHVDVDWELALFPGSFSELADPSWGVSEIPTCTLILLCLVNQNIRLHTTVLTLLLVGT